jgi:hypothetical protein
MADAPAGQGGVDAPDQAASGSILNGDPAVEARYAHYEQTRQRRGGGHVACRYYDDGTGDEVNLGDIPPGDYGLGIDLVRDCWDTETNESLVFEVITYQPGNSASLMPASLAELAEGRLPLPLPDIAFSPPLDDPDDFVLVNLPVWLRVQNWAPLTRTASAGPVTATVTAVPVRQEWDFDPWSTTPELKGGCAAQGAQYDPSVPYEAQSSPCTFTFRHSSAGRRGSYPDAYEAQLTVVYEVSWTSNLGVGGSLGELRRTTVRPVRVGEQQALNESGGTSQ